MGDGAAGRFAAAEFLDLGHTEHGDLFAAGEPVWAAIAKIGDYLATKVEGVASIDSVRNGEISAGAVIGERVYLADGVKVEPGAVVEGPAWIGENCTIRSGAYLRGNVIAGAGCVLGHSSEFKNCLLFDACQVPHFNYVGDSILGYRAHLGAGVILSNVRLDKSEIVVRDGATRVGSGLKKFGAVIGDGVEIGCNSVINPGSLIGRGSVLYPGTHWSGVLAAGQTVKVRQVQEIVAQRGDR